MTARRELRDLLRCSFCDRSQETTGKLISAPSDYRRAYICDECIASCAAILERAPESAAPDSRMPRRAALGESNRCSFCHKRQRDVEDLIAAAPQYGETYICSECIAICSVILEDDRMEPPSGAT